MERGSNRLVWTPKKQLLWMLKRLQKTNTRHFTISHVHTGRMDATHRDGWGLRYFSGLVYDGADSVDRNALDSYTGSFTTTYGMLHLYHVQLTDHLKGGDLKGGDVKNTEHIPLFVKSKYHETIFSWIFIGLRNGYSRLDSWPLKKPSQPSL